jgi:hypothetical protein
VRYKEQPNRSKIILEVVPQGFFISEDEEKAL